MRLYANKIKLTFIPLSFVGYLNLKKKKKIQSYTFNFFWTRYFSKIQYIDLDYK